MKKLLLMRHGDASAAADDKDRMLTDLGRAQCKSLSKRLALLNQGDSALSHVLSSDFQRAIDSAHFAIIGDRNIASKHIVSQKIASQNDNSSDLHFSTSEALRPMADPKEAFQRIMIEMDEVEDNCVLLVVCHMPIISALAGLAIDGNLQSHRGFLCASLMHMQSELPCVGGFDLVSHENP